MEEGSNIATTSLWKVGGNLKGTIDYIENEEKTFNELTGKRVKGTNLVIDQALETVKFNMDYKGVQLKSEAAISVRMTALRPNDPRYFNFDDTFFLFLKEKGKEKPYFALRVYDISKFQ